MLQTKQVQEGRLDLMDMKSVRRMRNQLIAVADPLAGGERRLRS